MIFVRIHPTILTTWIIEEYALKAVSIFLLAILALPVRAQWSSTVLSKARYGVGAATAGSKAFFAGGDNDRNTFRTVDIYDNDTNSWSTDSLSEPRIDLAAISMGTKVFFAGGFSGTDFLRSIDVFDVTTSQWSLYQLSQARSELCAATVGTKVFFAGGRISGGLERSDVIDIFDIATNTWTVRRLSQPRSKLVAAAVGTKVFFAGGLGTSRVGISKTIDIYDDANNTWSTHQLSRERYDLVAATVGTKVFFAGGISARGDSDVVDIYDNNTNSWTTHRLSTARFDLAATTLGDKVFFAGGYSYSTGTSSDVVDIYNYSSNTWTTSTLSEARNSMGATSVGSKAIFAGGWGNSSTLSVNIIDIYDLGAEKDVEPPNVTLSYPHSEETTSNGKYQVEITIIDDSPLLYVLLNNEEKPVGNRADSITIECEVTPGEIITVKTRDTFNNVAERSFVVKPLQTSLSTPKSKTRYYALLIAVENYQDADFEPLNEPIRDATALKELLVTKYTFNDEDVTLLANPSFEDLGLTFETLTNKITAKDLLLIFYAGHGFFDEKTNIGYWLPADASKANKVKWFRNSTLVENIRSIDSKHTLLISDACFSGGIFRTRTPYNNASGSIYDMLKRPSRKAITSGSLTTVPDKSIFMKYLLKTLNENNKQYLPAEDLYDEIRQAMKNTTELKPAYGEIQNTGDQGGNFVFVQRKERN